MKYLFSIILMISMISTVNAQSEATADVEVSADVIAQLETEVLQDLNFGLVAQGSTENVDPESDGRSAKVKVTGSGSTDIEVSVPTTVTLTGAGDDINVDISQPRSNTTDDQSGSTLETNDFTLSGNNEYFIWIGGEVTIPSTQTVDTYTGTLTVEMNYII